MTRRLPSKELSRPLDEPDWETPTTNTRVPISRPWNHASESHRPQPTMMTCGLQLLQFAQSYLSMSRCSVLTRNRSRIVINKEWSLRVPRTLMPRSLQRLQRILASLLQSRETKFLRLIRLRKRLSRRKRHYLEDYLEIRMKSSMVLLRWYRMMMFLCDSSTQISSILHSTTTTHLHGLQAKEDVEARRDAHATSREFRRWANTI